MQIREATLADIPAVIQIQTASWLAGYPNKDYGITEDDIKTIDFKAKYAEWQHMVQSQQYQVLVAMAEGSAQEAIIGFSTVYNNGNELEVYALNVMPEFQRQGIGSALLTQSLETTEDKPIKLQVAVYNKPAIMLYKKYGFRLSSNHGKYHLPNGKDIPTIEMVSGGTQVQSDPAITSPEVPRRVATRVGLSRLTGIRPSTIKHYTEIGLLGYYQEAEGMRRYYDVEVVLARLQQINDLKAQGKSLPQIKQELS